MIFYLSERRLFHSSIIVSYVMYNNVQSRGKIRKFIYNGQFSIIV